MAKALSLLRSGGYLAMRWNMFRDPTGDDQFGNAVQPLLGVIDQPPSFIGDSHYSLHSA